MPLALRPARDADYDFYVRLMPELAVGDPPAAPEKWKATQLADTLIAERGGVAVGICWWQQLEGNGYVRHLIVAPEARRLGVGRALLEDVAWRLRAAGCTTWRLNVKPDNAPAIALYRALGMSREYRSNSLRVDWPVLERLPATTLQATLVEPADDAALEAAFSLPAGQVAHDRRTGRVLLRVGPPLVGFAAFNPDFPGSFPFRARSSEAARAILEAMRAHSRPGATYAGVVVENDDALAATLRAAGAVLRLEFDHYSGAL